MGHMPTSPTSTVAVAVTGADLAPFIVLVGLGLIIYGARRARRPEAPATRYRALGPQRGPLLAVFLGGCGVISSVIGDLPAVVAVAALVGWFALFMVGRTVIVDDLDDPDVTPDPARATHNPITWYAVGLCLFFVARLVSRSVTG